MNLKIKRTFKNVSSGKDITLFIINHSSNWFRITILYLYKWSIHLNTKFDYCRHVFLFIFGLLSSLDRVILGAFPYRWRGTSNGWLCSPPKISTWELSAYVRALAGHLQWMETWQYGSQNRICLQQRPIVSLKTMKHKWIKWNTNLKAFLYWIQ